MELLFQISNAMLLCFPIYLLTAKTIVIIIERDFANGSPVPVLREIVEKLLNSVELSSPASYSFFLFFLFLFF